MKKFVLLFLIASITINSILAGPSLSSLKKGHSEEDVEVSQSNDHSLGDFGKLPVEILDHIASYLSSNKIENDYEAAGRIDKQIYQCRKFKEFYDGKRVLGLVAGRSYYDNKDGLRYMEHKIIQKHFFISPFLNQKDVIVELPVKTASALWHKTLGGFSNFSRMDADDPCQEFDLWAPSPDLSVFVVLRQIELCLTGDLQEQISIYVYNRKTKKGIEISLPEVKKFVNDKIQQPFSTLAVSSQGDIALADSKSLYLYQLDTGWKKVQMVDRDFDDYFEDTAYRHEEKIYSFLGSNKQGTKFFARCSSDGDKYARMFSEQFESLDNYEVYDLGKPKDLDKKTMRDFLRSNHICTANSLKRLPQQ
jgi:hypothetical protein